MKKYVIGVSAFLLLCLLFISVPLMKRYRVNGFVKEFTYIHMLSWDQIEPFYVRAESNAGAYALTEGNLSYAADALTHANSLDFRFTMPDWADCANIRLLFPDGAELIVADGGTTKSGKDLAYIISTYQGKTRAFDVKGLGTFTRISQCVSSEGFGKMGANTPLA